MDPWLISASTSSINLQEAEEKKENTVIILIPHKKIEGTKELVIHYEQIPSARRQPSILHHDIHKLKDQPVGT